MSRLTISENDIINNLINKTDTIKENLLKIKQYTEHDNTKQIEYLEKLNLFSSLISELEAVSNDMTDLYIMQTDTGLLSQIDKDKQKQLQIQKKVQDTFLPYMLYLQIILRST